MFHAFFRLASSRRHYARIRRFASKPPSPPTDLMGGYMIIGAMFAPVTTLGMIAHTVDEINPHGFAETAFVTLMATPVGLLMAALWPVTLLSVPIAMGRSR